MEKILLIYISKIISVNELKDWQGWKVVLRFLCFQGWDKDLSVSKSDSKCGNIYLMPKQTNCMKVRLHYVIVLLLCCKGQAILIFRDK